MEKYCFLDMDGVLVTKASIKITGYAGPRKPECIDKAILSLFNGFVEKSGCRVVLSSSWRILGGYGATNAALRIAGSTFDLIGETPTLSGQLPSGLYVGRIRGDEIRAWMDERSILDSQIVIIDDSDDMGDLEHRLVQTTWERGLETSQVEKAMKLLAINTILQ